MKRLKWLGIGFIIPVAIFAGSVAGLCYLIDNYVLDENGRIDK